MGSQNMSRTLVLWLAMVMVLVNLSKGDFDQDKAKCGDILIGLATCLPYVSGQSKAPTMNCCAGLKPVVQNNRVCLCILIRDRDDPNLGIKINATLALGLPDTCKTPSNVTECPKLMNLPPNSPEAKIFLDWGKNAKASNTSTAVTPSGNGKVTSSGDVGRVEKYWGVLYVTIIFLFQIA
ncbi:non-specific lipid transfer protein GPI-anchored 14-like [Rutidosis leptorrhynchoides]|uniref:non-specific lipid transfer protein GPI-anchored 14-like n=1 Tax=Rutidosis leptorrhynchoides TaxID=125765 RepID=UPI003A9977FC